jgi:hypothetical protein
LEHYLRSFVGDKPTSWVDWLPWAEWWYNITFHLATQMTPFEAVYGYPPPRVSSYLPGSSPVHLVGTTLKDRDTLLRLLRENLLQVQERMRYYANKQRSER